MTKNKISLPKFNPKSLPYIAAIAQAAQYAHAGYIFFGWVGLGIGIFLGVPVSLSAATAASKINDIAKTRKRSAWIALVLLFIISPAIIGISVYQEMNVANEIARGFASALWGLSADLAVGLTGFIIGGGLVEKETSEKKTGSTGQTKATSPNQKRSSAMSKIVQCPHCLEKMTQAKLNNHKSSCESVSVFKKR